MADTLYTRDEHNRLIVLSAWTIPHLPMGIIIELPDGSLKYFGVQMQDYYDRHPERTFTARLPKDEDLHDYKGYAPKTIPTAKKLTVQDGAIYGLHIATETASDMGHKGGSVKSPEKISASRENGKKGGRPRKVIN